MLKRMVVSVGIILSSLSLTSCDGIKDTFGVANRVPIIASFDYSPKSGMTRNDIITFSVVANDPEGKPLQYTWTATKGILSANSGNTVSWRPLKLDGSFESGLSNVSVIVSDGVMTNSANVNIFMQGESVTVATPNTMPTTIPSVSPSISPSVSPSPSVVVSQSATPTVVPSITSSPIPTITPTPIPSPTVSVTPIPSPSVTPSISTSTTPSASPSPSVVVNPSPSSVMVTQ